MMKKNLFLIAVVVLLGSFSAFAQNGQPHKGKKSHKKEMCCKEGKERPTAEQRADRMAKQLDLTAAQKSEVQALLEKQHAEHQKARSEANKTEPKQMRDKSKREAFNAELQKIIGKEKFEQLQAARADQHAKKHPKHDGKTKRYHGKEVRNS